MNKKKILHIQNIAKFINKKKILENIEFEIFQNQITVLIGQNGSGKSSLAKIILGLDKNFQGQVNLFTNKIGYIPQENNFKTNIPLRVMDLIMLLSEKKILDKKIGIKNFLYFTTDEIANQFLDMAKIQDKDISELSEGEMQKILIISILSKDVDFFILDEPNKFLDLYSQELLYKILKDLAKNAKKAVLIISHDLFAVMKHSDKVICINKHICCSGSVQDIHSNKKLSDALSEVGFYVHDHDHVH